MEVRCPQCHSSIDLAADTPLSEIACPSCGGSFGLLGEETIAYEATQVKTIGHFEVVDQIGVGSFGSVWKARDTELDRMVAVKIPRKGQLDPAETEQFLREARAAAQLRHPNILSVHEVGRAEDTVYIVSDLVEGLTLADWLTGQQMTPREAAQLCAKIAGALHHAHEAGVIHRDLKPGNVILDAGGEPYVMDFGLARREASEVTMTVEGKVLGTPAYMSPEQAKGEAHQADRRSDVYSLGVILFELLTGDKPFRGNLRMLLHQVINAEAPSPRKFNRNIPRDLETICVKCLEKNPGGRYASARELADDLQRFLNRESISARPISRPARLCRWCTRNPLVASLVGVSTVLLAALIVVFCLLLSASREAERMVEQLATTQGEIRRITAEIERAESLETIMGTLTPLQLSAQPVEVPDLEKLADEKVPWLLEQLRHRFVMVRLPAAETLGAFGRHAGKDAIRALEHALSDDDGTVRDAAAEALKKIEADGGGP